MSSELLHTYYVYSVLCVVCVCECSFNTRITMNCPFNDVGLYIYTVAIACPQRIF